MDSDEEAPSSSNTDVNMESATLKRKLSEDEGVSSKKKRVDPAEEQDDDIIALD